MADNRNDYTDVKFSQTQKNMYNGFSEDLYGNNWFILTTNDIGKGGFGNGRSYADGACFHRESFQIPGQCTSCPG